MLKKFNAEEIAIFTKTNKCNALTATRVVEGFPLDIHLRKRQIVAHVGICYSDGVSPFYDSSFNDMSLDEALESIIKTCGDELHQVHEHENKLEQLAKSLGIDLNPIAQDFDPASN